MSNFSNRKWIGCSVLPWLFSADFEDDAELKLSWSCIFSNWFISLNKSNDSTERSLNTSFSSSLTSIKHLTFSVMGGSDVCCWLVGCAIGREGFQITPMFNNVCCTQLWLPKQQDRSNTLNNITSLTQWAITRYFFQPLVTPYFYSLALQCAVFECQLYFKNQSIPYILGILFKGGRSTFTHENVSTHQCTHHQCTMSQYISMEPKLKHLRDVSNFYKI